MVSHLTAALLTNTLVVAGCTVTRNARPTWRKTNQSGRQFSVPVWPVLPLDSQEVVCILKGDFYISATFQHINSRGITVEAIKLLQASNRRQWVCENCCKLARIKPLIFSIEPPNISVFSKWHWDRFLSQYLSFPCHYHSTNALYHLHLHITLTRQTKRRSLGNFRNSKALSETWDH